MLVDSDLHHGSHEDGVATWEKVDEDGPSCFHGSSFPPSILPPLGTPLISFDWKVNNLSQRGTLGGSMEEV